MGKQKKTMERLLAGQADAHMGFDDLRSLLLSLGFEERIRGSHHLFSKRGIVEKINLNAMAVMPNRIKSGKCVR